MPIGQRGVKRKAPALIKPVSVYQSNTRSINQSTKSVVKAPVKSTRPIFQSVADSINQLTDDWDAAASSDEDDNASKNEQSDDEQMNESVIQSIKQPSQPTRAWHEIQSLANPKFPHVKPYRLPSKLIDVMTNEFHFPQSTPVQYQSIPYLLSNFDPIIESLTGSGKTLAYVLPVLALMYRKPVNPSTNQSWKKHEIGAIILAPTHELAKQIESVIQLILKHVNQPSVESSSHSTNQDDLSVYPSINHSLILLSLIGGVRDPSLDISAYQNQGGNIVVATPGRLEQFLKSNQLNVRELSVLIMDEADQLLSSGFEISINHILSALPKQRRTALFSATQQSINEQQIRRCGMKHPQYIQVSVTIKKAVEPSVNQSSKPSTAQSSLMPILTQNTPLQLTNHYIEIPVVDKFAFLLKYIFTHQSKKVIVFLMTCAAVDYFTAAIEDYIKEVAEPAFNQPVVAPTVAADASNDDAATTTSSSSSINPTRSEIVNQTTSQSNTSSQTTSQSINIPIIALHGRLPGVKRAEHLSRFTSLPNGVLIASDVAARGLDIIDVDTIIQFDAPNKPDFFIHRVGRTARAGRAGSALILVSPHEDVYPNFLVKQGVPIEQKQQEDLIDIAHVDNESIKQHVNSITCDTITDWLFARCLRDRAFFEGAQSALVSFLRGYKEHELKFIFEFHRLPFTALARLYGCLLFPLMSDLKHLKIDYDSGIKFDAQLIAFTDPKREKQRQANEAIKREKRQTEKDARIADMKARIKAKGTLRDQIREKREKRKPHMQIKAEWEELAKDTRAMKKEKKGKLTKKQMEAVLMGKASDDDESEESESD